MRKKNTTPRETPAQKETDSLKAHEELAELISTVLNHPCTPNEVFNRLSDYYAESISAEMYASKEFIFMAMRYRKREEGGVR